MSETACILLLEPEIIARQPLADYLRDCGYKIFEAATAAEARTLLEDGTLSIDALLADSTNDAAATFALAQWVRQTFPAMPIILAGTIDKTIAAAADLCSDSPALTKPYDHQHVLNHIKRALAMRRR